MISIDKDLARHIHALGNPPEPPVMVCCNCKSEHSGDDERERANEIYEDWCLDLTEYDTINDQQPKTCIECTPEDFYDDGSDNWRNE